MNPTSATADGKKIAFLQYFGHPTVYVADLESGGKHIGGLRHLRGPKRGLGRTAGRPTVSRSYSIRLAGAVRRFTGNR